MSKNLTRGMVLVLLFVCAPLKGAGAAGPANPMHLRCEYLSDPMGIDVQAPRFSWVLEHPQRGETQTAYQMLVASRLDLLGRNEGDVWDSGRVASDDSTQVVYHGKPLRSGRTYYWKVRAWDKEQRASPYSALATFDMGLLSRDEWKGKWITGNELRKQFKISGRVVRARLYVTALGYYEVHLNGRKVGDRVLDPAWTTYPKRVLYSTYDVTTALQSGENAMGVWLGGGWATLGHGVTVSSSYYAEPALLLQMNIETADGKELSVASDGTWKTTRGPIVSDSVYDGDTYDGRRETPGWDRPGFDDSSWTPVRLVPGSQGVLSPQMMPPIRVVDSLVPRRMTSPRKGVFVFDMGQNMSGWGQLRVRGLRGTRVQMRYAETLFPNGMINRENLRQAKARDVCILRGGGEEVCEPHFTYHGFRYVEVRGYPGTPGINSLRGQVAHTAVEPVGGFSASTPILNDLQRAIVWTQLSNLFSIPTDCDQRDERQGWLGDAQLSAEEAMMNFDMAAFYTNFIRGIRDEQGADGALPETVPEKYGQRPGDPAWQSAYPLLCWYMWRQYGDRRILEENYDGLKKFVGFLESRAPGHVLRFNWNGDWIATVDTPGAIISDFYYYFDVTILRDIAKALGKTADAQTYSHLAEQIKTAFQQNFFDAKTGQYLGRTQTADALALYLDLLTPKQRGSVSFDLEKDVHYRHDNHLTTGIIGTKYLLPALTATGRGDLAYQLAIQTTYPSWGYMLRNGGTTIWEQWQKWSRAWMNSYDHPALASVGAWLYQSLGGITLGASGEGYRHIRIAPLVVEGLDWASASVETIRGTVASSWGQEPGNITLDVAIPVNSDAEVVIPQAGDMTEMTLSESGRVIWRDGRYLGGDEGVTEVRHEGGLFVVSVGSGHYSFELAGN